MLIETIRLSDCYNSTLYFHVVKHQLYHVTLPCDLCTNYKKSQLLLCLRETQKRRADSNGISIPVLIEQPFSVHAKI